MGRLLGLLLLVAALGGVFTVYNAYRYELVQPYPVAWNHDDRELELLELLRVRREVAGRLASTRRVTGGTAGVLMPPSVGEGAIDPLRAELDRLDARIAELQAVVAARKR